MSSVINLGKQEMRFFFTVRDPSKLAKIRSILNRCHDYTLQTVRSTHSLILSSTHIWSLSKWDQGIWDLSMVYLPELLEHVSAGEVVKVDSNLSICIYLTVFAFVTAYNNKKVCAIFGFYITPCVQSLHIWFSKFPIFKKIRIYMILF